jgi:5-bromo-4-chloroindolyl phosphate hydrolysis protein
VLALGIRRSDLAGAAAAIVVLLAALFLLNLPVWLALPVAVVIYVAVRLIWQDAPKEVLPGMSDADVRLSVKRGRDTVGRIQQSAAQIQKPAVKANVLKICSIANDILTDFQQDPKDVIHAPNFLDDMLNPLANVVDRYVRLAAHGSEAGADATLTKIETDLFPTVEKNFSGLYRQLVEDDVIDLDAASEGLKALTDLEGSGG